MRTPRRLALGFALGLLAAAPTYLAAQEPTHMQQQQHQQMQMQQQQMLRMQEQVHQLNRTMEQVSDLQQRAHAMEHYMAQEMERIRERSDLAGQNTLQLRNQERIRNMAHAMSEGAQEMERAMEQLRNMAEEPGAVWDRDMERDMVRLREHWQEMTGQLEQGLQIMERLRDRIHQPQNMEEAPLGER